MEPRDRGKRKMAEKDMPHRGRGRSTTAGGSGTAPHGRGDRGRHDQYIKDEERLEMLGHTTNVIPDTPLHITKFDISYIRDFEGEMIMRPPDDTRLHAVVNYSKSWKLVEEARGLNPYAVHKDLGTDYMF
jgi:hypothetical protein